MNKKVLSIIGLALLTISCSVERAGVSPIANLTINNQNNSLSTKNLGENIELIKYASEITNAFDSHSFTQKEVNETVSELKFYVSEYLYAVKEHNIVGQDKALYKYEQTYKKVQKKKSKLNPEEQEVLNRFLVNLKTNMSLIENLKDKS